MQGTEVLYAFSLGNTAENLPDASFPRVLYWNLMPRTCCHISFSTRIAVYTCLFCISQLFILRSSVMAYSIVLRLLSLYKVCGNDTHIYSYLTTAFQRCFASRFHVVLAKKNCVHAFKSNNSSFISVLSWCQLVLISVCRQNAVVLQGMPSCIKAYVIFSMLYFFRCQARDYFT